MKSVAARRVLAAVVVGAALLVGAPEGRSGELHLVETAGWPIGPLSMRDVVTHPDGDRVFVLLAGDWWGGPLGIAVFRRDPATGRLTYETLTEFTLSGEAALAISPDGRHLYVASQKSVDVFEWDADAGRVVYVGFTGPGALTTMNETIVVAPDGGHVYTAGISSVYAYERDPSTGLLTVIDADIEPHEDPLNRSLDISPDGENLYVGELGRVAVFAIDGDSGAVDRIQTLGASDGLEDLLALHIGVSPDGRHVYASGPDDGVVVFARDPTSGALALVERIEGSGMGTVWGVLAVSPDGLRVYVTGDEVPDVPELPFLRDGVTVFARDPATGRLSYRETFIDYEPRGMFRPGGVAFGAGGRDVYLATAGAGTVGVLRVMPDCAPEPRTDCRQPTGRGRSRLRLKDSSNDEKDRLVWRWRRGEATPPAALGDPTGLGDYVFCLYDQTGPGAWEVRFRQEIPAGATCGDEPCWTVVGDPAAPLVVRHRDPGGEGRSGIESLEIRAGGPGEASVELRGGGSYLRLPDLPLAQAPSVVAQLVNRAGECWGAEFSAPAPAHGARSFKDRSD